MTQPIAFERNTPEEAALSVPQQQNSRPSGEPPSRYGKFLRLLVSAPPCSAAHSRLVHAHSRLYVARVDLYVAHFHL